MCSACLYGKSTKRPWRTKGDDMTGALKQATYPGQCIAVDQSESPVAWWPNWRAYLQRNAMYVLLCLWTCSLIFSISTSSIRLMPPKPWKPRMLLRGLQKVMACQYKLTMLTMGILQRTSDNKMPIRRGRIYPMPEWMHIFRMEELRRKYMMQDMAWTQLIHAHRHWPDAISWSIKVQSGFAMDFLWLSLDFFPVRGTTIYVHVYGYKRRVHIQIKGMARSKPLQLGICPSRYREFLFFFVDKSTPYLDRFHQRKRSCLQ